MGVSRIRTLRGPNLWCRHTAIEVIVACSDQSQLLAELPGFEDRLRARFPMIGPIRPDDETDAPSIAHVLGAAVPGLQAAAGCSMTFSHTEPTLEPGTYQAVTEYAEEEVGRLASELAGQLCLATRDDQPFDLDDTLHRLRELDEDVRLGPNTGSIVGAAVARGIPYRRLTQGSMVQFGWGSKQRRIWAAETDMTSAVAESIAQDKDLTKALLHAAGVPVPLGHSVRSVKKAWEAAQEIHGSVVIKPRDGNQGKGMVVCTRTREGVMTAYKAAADISPDVIVECYIPGHDFRLLMVGKHLAAAAHRDPSQIIDDGKHTVRELVSEVNRNPRCGEGHATSFMKIRFDDIALATLTKRGLSADAVPPKGACVVLRNNANLSTGGTATGMTDDVYPAIVARAMAAMQMVGLDICGVDVVCETMLKPFENQAGGIVEVSAAPDLCTHLQPPYGKGRAAGEAIVPTMFADGDNGRIPVMTVSGTNGKTTTVHLITHLLAPSGLRMGMTGTDGVYIQGQRIDTGDCSGPCSARNVLLHPDVDATVFEITRGGLLREGLAFDHCDVAMMTSVGEGDHLGLNYISMVKDLAVLRSVIVQNVTPRGMAVLNATGPMVARMTDGCPDSVAFFAHDPSLPTMARHRAQGKRVAFVDGPEIVVTEGADEIRIALADIPLTRNGAVGFQVENTMSPIAAARTLGIDWTVIRRGLATFMNDAVTAPGRFDLLDYKSTTLIADYGHNPDAIQALRSAVATMPAQQRMVVISGAGDRRDEDIRKQTQILGDVFDDVVLYEDQCQRGRADGEVLALLCEGLQGASRTSRVEEIRGEFLAIDTALGRLRPGDLCLILTDQVEEALEHIARRVAE